MSAERGVIRNKARGRQLNSFKDLVRKRNITPTDIDGFLDYGGKAFIYMEGKTEKADFIDGQKRALMAAVLSHWKAGHPSMAILYEHNIPVDEEVPTAWQFVKGVFCIKQIPCLQMVPHSNGSPTYPMDAFWFKTQTHVKVREAIEMFENYFQVF